MGHPNLTPTHTHGYQYPQPTMGNPYPCRSLVGSHSILSQNNYPIPPCIICTCLTASNCAVMLSSGNCSISNLERNECWWFSACCPTVCKIYHNNGGTLDWPHSTPFRSFFLTRINVVDGDLAGVRSTCMGRRRYKKWKQLEGEVSDC